MAPQADHLKEVLFFPAEQTAKERYSKILNLQEKLRLKVQMSSSTLSFQSSSNTSIKMIPFYRRGGGS